MLETVSTTLVMAAGWSSGYLEKSSRLKEKAKSRDVKAACNNRLTIPLGDGERLP